MVGHPAQQPPLPQPPSCSQGGVPASWGPTCSPISQREALGAPSRALTMTAAALPSSPRRKPGPGAPPQLHMLGALVGLGGMHPPPLVPTGATHAGKPLTHAACLSQLGSGLTQTPDWGRLHHCPLLYPSLSVSFWGSGPASPTSTPSAVAHIQPSAGEDGPQEPTETTNGKRSPRVWMCRPSCRRQAGLGLADVPGKHAPGWRVKGGPQADAWPTYAVPMALLGGRVTVAGPSSERPEGETSELRPQCSGRQAHALSTGSGGPASRRP
uniref:Uncharacterized protein n=1 Tax=Rangifer tarandus platyrhynchus TaxID=3082113 RepID=A0ACB0DZN1_RANTA|nr:unnamed protein product [Rangifer tarandus platyrhynchus]